MEVKKTTNDVNTPENKTTEALKSELENYKRKLTEANRKISENRAKDKTLKLARECKADILQLEGGKNRK